MDFYLLKANSLEEQRALRFSHIIYLDSSLARSW